jgi:hypothetical protein
MNYAIYYPMETNRRVKTPSRDALMERDSVANGVKDFITVQLSRCHTLVRHMLTKFTASLLNTKQLSYSYKCCDNELAGKKHSPCLHLIVGCSVRIVLRIL